MSDNISAGGQDELRQRASARIHVDLQESCRIYLITDSLSGTIPYMEVDMELTHKTTILFSEEQIDKLKKIANEKKTSMGELIRTACSTVYALEPDPDAIDAVKKLSNLNLPVSDVASMKKEQIPYKDFSL